MKYTMKKDYTKPRLSLLTPNKTVLTTLTDRTHLSAYNIEVTEKMNEVNNLTFSIPFSNTKINNDSCENLVKLGFEHYIIKDVATSDSDSRSKTVTCVHEAHEIKGIMCSAINQIGVTAQVMFNAIKSSASIPLTNYIWKGTDISDSTMRSLIVEGEKSVFENLLIMAELFQGWIEFSTNVYGEIQVYLRKNTIKRGKYVKKGQDLKQLDITYNTNEIFTKLTPFGAEDKIGQELNILAVNPTGKSYVENYDYYLAKGMTLEQIKATPKCQQEKIMRENDITDANELLRVAQEELGRCCVPKLEGSVDMADISVFEESAKLSPILGEEIITIDEDIKFNMSAMVVGITRNYDTPLTPKIEISNVIKYDSIIKDLVHSAEKVDKVIGSENGKPYVIASHVKGIIDSAKTTFYGMLDSIESPEQKLAILFEDRRVGNTGTFGATAIGTSGLLISNELDINGQWIWKTLANANGYYADMVVGKIIQADLIKTGILSSFNDKTWINMDDGTFNFADKVKFINNLFEINSGNVIINANGETINNGALTIKNKASETVLSGDADGNLTMNGVFKTYVNGNRALELNGTQMLFYDWQGTTRTVPVGRMHSTRVGGDVNKQGLTLANYTNSLLSVSYYDESTGNFYPYMYFDEQNLLGKNCAIIFQRHFAMKQYRIFLGNDNANQIWSNGGVTVFQYPTYAGAGFSFETATTTPVISYLITDTPTLKLQVNTACLKDFTVVGSKNSLQKTKNYGERLINAYETAEYYFGDIGSGKIINGECTVYVDEILQECVNMEMQYHVFTQVYNGKITSIERYKNYFIVKGEENTEFSWELKAKRIGYEYARLESPSNNDSNIVNLDKTLTEGITEVSDSNKLIEDELNYNLTDLLLS